MIRQHKCFHCGEPTRTLIQTIRPIAHARYICRAQACADAWYALVDKKKAAA